MQNSDAKTKLLREFSESSKELATRKFRSNLFLAPLFVILGALGPIYFPLFGKRVESDFYPVFLGVMVVIAALVLAYSYMRMIWDKASSGSKINRIIQKDIGNIVWVYGSDIDFTSWGAYQRSETWLYLITSKKKRIALQITPESQREIFNLLAEINSGIEFEFSYERESKYLK